MSAALDLRTRQLAAIHAGRKQIGMEEDDYRAIVSRISRGRTESSGEMTDTERARLLDHLKTLGAGKKPSGKSTMPARARPPEKLAPQVGKLRALWISLWQLGVVDHREDTALAAFVRRQTGLDAWSWNSAEHLRAAIEALKEWGKRFEMKAPDRKFRDAVAAARLAAGLDDGGSAFEEKVLLIRAQWSRLGVLGAVAQADTLGAWLQASHGVTAGHFLSGEQADAAIADLGTQIRRTRKSSDQGG